MASLAARAARNHEARQRLDTALQRVSKRLDIPIPDESRRMRDPDLQPIVEIERFAGFVETIDERLEAMAEGDEAPEGRASWSIAMLRDYAKEQDIEIPGDVRKKVDIAEYIESVEAERETEQDIDGVDDPDVSQEGDGLASSSDASQDASFDEVEQA